MKKILKLLVKALGASEAVIAFKVHKEDMKEKILELLPQYEGINLFYMLQMKKAMTMYGPHRLLLKSF